MSYANVFLGEVVDIAKSIRWKDLEDLIEEIIDLRDRRGTLYIIGLGGSAANATHMSADFRKLCHIDARSLDNMAELTARANDEGWKTIFDGLIKKISNKDALFVLSVGGGTISVSTPLINAIDKAKSVNAKILGIVGPDGGYTSNHGDCVINIPCTANQTPHTEAFQAVIWHYLVSHPSLQQVPNKWV